MIHFFSALKCESVQVSSLQVKVDNSISQLQATPSVLVLRRSHMVETRDVLSLSFAAEMGLVLTHFELCCPTGPTRTVCAHARAGLRTGLQTRGLGFFILFLFPGRHL